MSWRIVLAFLVLGISAAPAPGQRIFALLRQDKPGPKNIADADTPPHGALARLGTLRLSHQEPVVGLAFSQDGRQILTHGSSGTFAAWSAQDGHELRRLAGEEIKTIRHYSFNHQMLRLQGLGWNNNRFEIGQDVVSQHGATSADGKYYAMASPKKGVVIWDVAAGVEARRFAGKFQAPLAFSADGTKLAALVSEGEETNVRIWDLKTGKESGRLKNPPGRGLSKLQFSPDGKALAGKDAIFVRVWNLETGKRIRLYASMLNSLTDFSYSPDGLWIAGLPQHGSVLVWDASSSDEAGKIAEADVHYTAFAFSPDGVKLAVADNLHQLSIWNWRTNKLLLRWVGHGSVQTLAWSGNGKALVSAGGDGILHVWDAATGKEQTYSRLPDISALAFRDDDRLTLIGSEGELIETTWKNGLVQRWKSRWSEQGSLFAGHAASQTAAWGEAESPQDFKVTLVNLAEGRNLVELNNVHVNRTSSIAFARDGRTAAFWDAKDELVRVLKVDGGKERRRFEAAAAALLAFSPDGATLAVLDWDNDLSLFEINSGQRRAQFPTTKSQVSCMEFSVDARWIALGCQDDTVRLWDTLHGAMTHILVGHRGVVSALAFSPDRKLLASAGMDGMIRLWNLADGKEFGHLQGHRGHVNALAFSADSRRLASAGRDATVIVWDCAKARRPTSGAEARDLDSLWDELADADAHVAFRAAAELHRRPADALRLFRARILPAGSVKADHIQTLIDELNAEQYPIRDQATKALEQLDTLAEPFLIKALAAKPGAESAKRLQHLVDRLDEPIRDPSKLRLQRAVEILERIATPAAQELLADWAQGAPEARFTRLASEARARLGPGRNGLK